MPQYLSPGVFVEEISSGPRPITGVGTSTAGMVGVTARGPDSGKPKLVTSLQDFHRLFGGFLPRPSDADVLTANGKKIRWWLLPLAVKGFFDNGGQLLYVKRVMPPADSTAASATIEEDPVPPAAAVMVLTAQARQKGEHGNTLKALLQLTRGAALNVVAPPAGSPPNTVTLASPGAIKDKDTVLLIPTDTTRDPSLYTVVGPPTENTVVGPPKTTSFSLTLDRPPAPAAIAGDTLRLVRFRLEIVNKPTGVPAHTLTIPSEPDPPTATLAELQTAVAANPDALLTLTIGAAPLPFLGKLVSRTDPNLPLATLNLTDGTGTFTAASYIGVDGGSGNRTGIQALEDIDEVSICAVPGVWDETVLEGLTTHCELLGDRFAVFDGPPAANLEDIRTFRAPLSTDRAALYYPWLQVPDPAGDGIAQAPPSGHMIGVYAKTDLERGVHKAPANIVLRGIVPGSGLAADITRREQDTLNPVGINVLRAFPNLGQRVWGARTLAPPAEAQWRYVNVRRLFLFIEESLDEGLQWVVFEPNAEELWASVRQSISSFLAGVWRSGALPGATEEEAFYVICDRTTMTEDDLAQGRLICQVGVAPVFPAEFVIVRIQQATRESIAT
ncbi:phage tail sheath subtilisin-like domain-containing protein [Streptomyces sp. NBC_01381]|uniref:phage tail sheath subtilisin-like domain-containing protein n=1 Tax=Streptomyces sp. NBC_01381 TaxID=2903845 RepID=UPI00225187DB|nr:phage tail sheath subtilisin-like domain-containing protein [Streptomyces sp. NBC_01381]MCX4673194.1 phage tail sheath subtilisin-like domain-containing protein [Streptomyces sp. NBC_01381]